MVPVVPGVHSIVQKLFCCMSVSIFVVGQNMSLVRGWLEVAALYCAHVLLLVVSLEVRTTAVSTVGSVKMLHKGAFLGKLFLAELALHHQSRFSSYFGFSSYCNCLRSSYKIHSIWERFIKVFSVLRQIICEVVNSHHFCITCIVWLW